MNTTGIRDEYLGEIEYSELNLPVEFIKIFCEWLSAYNQFNFIKAHLSKEDKDTNIKILDDAGLSFAKELKLLIPNGSKVSYYSDALQCKLTV